MLELAIQAGLPLIKVETDDTVNFPDILAHLADEDVCQLKEHVSKLGSLGFMQGTQVFFIINPQEIEYDQAYRVCVKTDRTLIVVNPEEPSPVMFDAGVVQLPKIMLEEFLDELADEEQVPHLMSVLGGLSLKDVAEVCRLCMAKYESLTPRGVTSVRRMYTSGLRGVQQVNTNYSFYKPLKALEDWLKVDGEIFKRDDVMSELVPRGLLMDGTPGTGKTMGAKYLANQLEVPLFRLDLGGMMAKYVGESEGNLNTALSQVDQSEPCILLIDEVEKVFKSGDDAGVTSRLLSQLLWWLQEHQTRVLTLFTTNDAKALPAELHRPGRIDKTVTFKGLPYTDAKDFAEALLEQFGEGLPVSSTKINNKILAHFKADNAGRLTQAEITQMIYKLAKQKIIENNI